MSHRLPIKDKASPRIEPAPCVTVEVSVNGKTQAVQLEFDKTETVKVSKSSVTLRVTGFERKNNRPIEGPPYTFSIDYTVGHSQRVRQRLIRSMDKENAVRIFRKQTEQLDRVQIHEVLLCE